MVIVILTTATPRYETMMLRVQAYEVNPAVVSDFGIAPYQSHFSPVVQG